MHGMAHGIVRIQCVFGVCVGCSVVLVRVMGEGGKRGGGTTPVVSDDGGSRP